MEGNHSDGDDQSDRDDCRISPRSHVKFANNDCDDERRDTAGESEESLAVAGGRYRKKAYRKGNKIARET